MKTDGRKVIFRRNAVLLLAFNIIVCALAWSLYSQLPEQVISHFNFKGEPDGTMSKAAFLGMFTVFSVLLPSGLHIFSPLLDPKAQNYEKFGPTYDAFFWLLSIFLHVVFGSALAYQLGWNVPITDIILIGMGLLWILIGNSMGRLRPNYFMGIRTPWTLDNENVWRLTHRFAARVWVISGFIFVVLAWATEPYSTATIILLVALVSAFLPVIYSFLLYRRQKQI
ncbi:SdpI family protein [Paenibacillus sp. 481]|uniref:SdpI family protein n=1 Tax=Paenibacillus sp. 481 TaxID=2835869 RepID=UPI001E6033BA|nr:SdpI family protein [Paenibacillus sp. 481]UHA74758.1 SdpI family protein [Paenibacillus sp. 481]